MQNLYQKFNDLKINEKILLVFASLLLLFVFTKLLIVDTQQKKLKNLKNRAALIQQQQTLLATSNPRSTSGQNKKTNVLISDFLRSRNSNEMLKNIRATNNPGEQRYELESIQFNTRRSSFAIKITISQDNLIKSIIESYYSAITQCFLWLQAPHTEFSFFLHH